MDGGHHKPLVYDPLLPAVELMVGGADDGVKANSHALSDEDPAGPVDYHAVV